MNEREWNRAGQLGAWVELEQPTARPKRWVKATSLKHLGHQMAGGSAFEIAADGKSEYLISRSPIYGADVVGVHISEDEFAWAVPQPLGSFERSQVEQPAHLGAIYSVERGVE